MARGVPVSPEQVEQIAESYYRTGNAAATARETGIPERTVRDVVNARLLADRRRAHARAVERGIRQARRSMVSAVARLERVMTVETDAGVSLEPRDLAALTNAQARAAEAVLAMQTVEDKRRESQLRRQLLRAQISAAREGTSTGDVVVVVRTAGDRSSVDADPTAE